MKENPISKLIGIVSGVVDNRRGIINSIDKVENRGTKVVHAINAFVLLLEKHLMCVFRGVSRVFKGKMHTTGDEDVGNVAVGNQYVSMRIAWFECL